MLPLPGVPLKAQPGSRPEGKPVPRKAQVPAVREATAQPHLAAKIAHTRPLAELDAMRAIAETLEQLEPDSAERVLAWIGWHYSGAEADA